MTTVKYAPRHRRACRPMAPAAQIEMTPVRGTAAVSVTGLALTAVVAPVVNAAPGVETATAEAAAVTTTASVDAAVNTVSVPDIAWDAADDVAVTAVAPGEAVHDTDDEVANRSEAREDLVGGEARAAAINAAGGDIVSIASSLLGIPYVYGGSSPAGFDCSGFTQYVYAMAGISIPRTSGEQGYAGTFVSAAEARPGDLVWHSYGHVGIYAGNGMVIEATTPGSTTTIQPLWGDYSFVRY